MHVRAPCEFAKHGGGPRRLNLAWGVNKIGRESRT
jgi:hypothetical protein